MFYVVFARINGIEEMPSDQIAGAVGRLTTMGVDGTGTNSEDQVKSHSSVYGRFWIAPKSVRIALNFAKTIVESAAFSGVSLGVGVAVGRIEITQDLLEQNVAGMAINHAARLAFLEDNKARVAVDAEVVNDALDAGPFTHESFGSPQNGQVKRTELNYRWLSLSPQILGKAPTSNSSDTLAHVVVYDIVRFSEMPQRDLVRSVEDLRHAVRRSLESAGLASWTDKDGLWYAPAGDGGVIVFGAERVRGAWTFAKALLAHTADRVPVRLGIASGVVVVLDKNLPVGKGVLRADRLSGLAEVGQPCVNQRFWKSLDDHEKEDWLSDPIPEDTDALKVRKRAVTGQHLQPAEEFASGPTHQTGTARGPVLGSERGTLVAFLSGLAPSSWATYLASIPRAAASVSHNLPIPEQVGQLVRWAESPEGPTLELLRLTAKGQFSNFR